MKNWLKGILFLGPAFLVIMSVLVLAYPSEPQAAAEVGVVMGTRVEANGEPSAKLRLRLDRAVELFHTGQVTQLWVTGGRGASGHSESAVMQQYLASQGVPEAAIHQDSLGISTFASARNLARNLPEATEVMLITHIFHLRRSRFAFEQFGVVVTQVAGVTGGLGSILYELYGVLRECLALPYYWLRDYV